MIANFARLNTPSGEVKGKPVLVSKEAADVIPPAEVIACPFRALPIRPRSKVLNHILKRVRTEEAADNMMDKINTDLIAIGKALTKKGVDWLEVHV